MSKPPRFAGLKNNIAAAKAPAPAADAVAVDASGSTKAKAREGKKAIVGYYSSDLSRELRMMSIAEGTSVQALLGEAIDMLLRARGKHPYGER